MKVTRVQTDRNGRQSDVKNGIRNRRTPEAGETDEQTVERRDR